MDEITNLKRIRNEKGFSQSQLANAAGVNVFMIQFYEQRYRDINQASASTLLKISNVLECSIEDLMEDE